MMAKYLLSLLLLLGVAYWLQSVSAVAPPPQTSCPGSLWRTHSPTGWGPWHCQVLPEREAS